MRYAALAISAGLTMLLSACGPPAASQANATARPEIYIHVDPATGCHYIVFPSGTATVRVRPDGAPYCDAAPANPPATP